MFDKETCQENTVWYLEHRLRHNLGVKCVTDNLLLAVFLKPLLHWVPKPKEQKKIIIIKFDKNGEKLAKSLSKNS